MKLTKLALACAITGALAACGGGGGSADNSSGGNGGAGTTRTLAGVAAKGLIKNGVVQVFSYDTAGKKSAQPMVTGLTSATDGSYSVNLGSNIGLFTIEVSAGPNTMIADEVLNSDIPMPANLTLRSLVQLDTAAGTTINGYVTPFTDMLVKAAESAGGLTNANVAAAQNGAIQILGFNPLTTKPINANSTAGAAATDPAEQLQSLALAAISRLANDGSLGCVEANISAKIKCVIDASTGSANLQNGVFSIPLTAQIALDAALKSVAADPAINLTKLTTLDGKTTFSQASVSTSGTVETPVAATKALFASLRTNIQAWVSAVNGGAAAKSASALKSDFETAIAPLDQSLADWMLMSERGIAFFNNYAAGKTSSNNTTFASSSGSYQYSYQPLGGCTIFADTTFTTPATMPSEARSVSCSLTPQNSYASGTYDQNGGSYLIKEITKSIRLLPVSGSTTNFTYKSRTRVQTTQYDYTYNPYTSTSTPSGYATVGDYGTTGFAEGTISFTMSGTAVASATINGFMPARTDYAGVAITDQEAWNVNYTRTLEADNVTYKYALSGDITALKGGVSVGAVALQNGSFIRALLADRVQDIKQVNLILAVTSKDSKVVGTLALDDFAADKTGNNVIPTSLKFSGSFNNAGAEFFNGTLTAKTSNYASYDSNTVDSAANFLNASVSFTGVAKIPSRPDLSLTLSARNTAFESYVFTGQYNDGANAILANTTNATGTQVINVFTSNGVTMQLVAGVNKVNVSKNNSIVASFDRSTGIINYADGSIESLK